MYFYFIGIELYSKTNIVENLIIFICYLLLFKVQINFN